MGNFFYRYSDYTLFQKAFEDVDGEDVVVNLMAGDESLKPHDEVEQKHVVRKKDNKSENESSFNKFFGPRKNFNQNFDMKDFSSWKNKNYRETEKQLGSASKDKFKFSFSDFMNERSAGRTYNDADQNRSNNQKAINEFQSDDPTFKRFSLNDYMRRLEERTRVKSETRDNEDLIDTIGDITQDITPTSSQDENFEENVSGISAEGFAQDEDFRGDKFAVDTSELEEMKKRLEEVKKQTQEINEIIKDDNPQETEILIEEDDGEESDETQMSEEPEISESEEIETDETDKQENPDDFTEELEPVSEEHDASELGQEQDDNDIPDEESKTTSQNDENSKGEETSGTSQTNGSTSQTISQTSKVEITKNQTESDEPSSTGEVGKNVGAGQTKIINIVGQPATEKSEDKKDTNQNDAAKSEQADEKRNPFEIVKLINQNEKEKQQIEEKLREAEKEKLSAMKSYESRLKELEQSIVEKDKETQKKILLEKIRNDNQLVAVKAEFKSREDEIRRLEKDAALKSKISALLKKELKNNLSISNLEMNNKLLEITTKLNQEKEKAKANKPKTTRKRTTKRKIDSDIIGNIDFD